MAPFILIMILLKAVKVAKGANEKKSKYSPLLRILILVTNKTHVYCGQDNVQQSQLFPGKKNDNFNVLFQIRIFLQVGMNAL